MYSLPIPLCRAKSKGVIPFTSSAFKLKLKALIVKIDPARLLDIVE